MNYPEDLKRVANRVVWFKPPDDALQKPKLFLAHLIDIRDHRKTSLLR
jgi:hypothetical protein